MFRIGREEADAAARVIMGGQLFKINEKYKECEQAEADMRRIFNVKNALLVTSGAAALTSALVALGVGPGDQVIVPGYTYIATAMAVVAVGAIPVIAECDDTLTIDPQDFEKKITPATKAVIPVHIAGFPCNMDAVCEIARKHGIKVLEDACQSDGGRYHGKRLGTIGEAGALSFNQFKLISCGEGGALLTDDDKICERALIYHDASAVQFFGNQLKEDGEPLFCGVEYRTDEIKAAILREQLKKMDGIIADLHRIKRRMMEELGEKFSFVRSNDSEGDVATTLAFAFNDAEKAKRFQEKTGGVRPIETGKHVYSHWKPILEKRGALHPAFDPFKMEANKGIIPDYSADMCPKTLDYLSKTVYIYLHPDMTEETMNTLIQTCLAAWEA